MINALDKQKNFLRPSFTLPGALEAFLDPVVTMVTLAACLAWYAHPLSARYIILGVIAFSLSFPGNVGFHEPPKRMVRKLLTNWLVFLVILIEAAIRRRKAEANPWGEGATTLEWTLSSPPPFHQFSEPPVIKADSH